MTTAEQRQKPWVEALREELGDAVSSEPQDLQAHGNDEGYRYENRPPECVAYARNKEDVVSVLRVAREHAVPVTARGAASSLEGNVLPVRGGISLDLTRMNRVISVDPQSMTVTVEAGVRRKELNRRLREHGLFLSVDPGADATVGGMAGTNASGSNALEYGSFRNQVLGMEVVLADGRVIRLGSKARKSSSGYALGDLFVGSEGTLGIITELTLMVHALPAVTASARALFPDVKSAVEAAANLVRQGLSLARLEMVDAECIRAVNRYKSADFPEQTTLWIEFHGGSEDAVADEIEVAKEICHDVGAQGDMPVARTPEEYESLWEARHHAWYAVDDYYEDQQLVSTDTCVPVAKLPEAIGYTQNLMREYSMVAPVVGHVGDGNFHVFFHVAPDDEGGWQRLGAVMEGMVRKALELGGTSTGEHGVGIRKKKYQELEHEEALSVMREVKELFDPLGILNPGKVLPES